MAHGGTKKAPRVAGAPFTLAKWGDLAAYRNQWRVLCGAKARGAVHTPPEHPRAQVADGPPPSNPAHPAAAPARPRRQQPCQPRIPAPNPELTATQ